MKYHVKNIYGIQGESTHIRPKNAIKARDKREGTGWIVVDEDGKVWDNYGPGRYNIVADCNRKDIAQ